MAANQTFKLFGIRRVVSWFLDVNNTTAASIVSGTGTVTVQLASGQGTGYSDATPAQPHRALIDNEMFLVTAVAGDNLTANRAADSTAGVAHSSGATVKHLHPVRLWKCSAFTQSADIQTIEFPGDGDVEQVFQSQGINGTFTLSKFVTDILDKIAGAQAATTNLRTGELQRWNPEIGTYPYVELQVDRRAVNDVTGAEETMRTTIWQTKLQKPLITGDAGNNAAETTTFNWSSNATSTDMLGRPIIGTGGVAITENIHYSYSEVFPA